MDTSTTSHSGGCGNCRKRTEGGGAEKSPREGPGWLRNEGGRQAGSDKELEQKRHVPLAHQGLETRARTLRT